MNTHQKLIKAVGVMQWLVNALDEFSEDSALKTIVKQDLKQQLKRTNVKLEEQLNTLLKGAGIEVHEQAQKIYEIIDDVLFIEE